MTDLDDDCYGDEPADPRLAVGANHPPSFEEELREAHKEVFLRVEAMKLARAKLPPVVNSDEDLAKIGRFVVGARDLAKAIKAAHQEAAKPIKERATTCDKLFLTRGLTGEVESMKAVVEALGHDYTARKEAERRRQLQAEADARRLEEEARAYEAAALKDAGSHSAAEVVESQSEHLGRMADRLETRSQGATADVVRTQMDGVTASGRKMWAYEIEDAEKIDLNLLRDCLYAHELNQWLARYVNGGGRELPGVRIFERTVATFR